MTELGGQPGSEALAMGHYARSNVELDSPGTPEQPLELSLAAPFGALFSTLFASKQLRVRSLSLDYVAPERLGQSVTFSARVSEIFGDGAAVSLSLLVSRGSWVCVRGSAVVAVSPALAAGPSAVAPSQAGETRSGREASRSSNGKLP